MRIRSMVVLSSVLTLIGGWIAFETLQADPRLTSDPEIDGANALRDAGRIMAKIARQISPSVVHIESIHRTVLRGEVEETGSGVIVRSQRIPGDYVVTNRHVIAGAKLTDIRITLFDGQQLHPERIWEDEASDVAVMKISAQGMQAAGWADSDAAEIGHPVLAVGSPFGLSQSVTFGIISAKSRRSLKLGDRGVLNKDFIQTDAAINPGNSGGPLIDLNGRVVGINTAIASNSGGNEGIGFSIPSNLVRRVVDQLLEYGKVYRAYLGVKLDPEFDIHKARALKLDRVRGARIIFVYPNTPAARAKLRKDDVILSFDGIDVHDENHLINVVSLSPVGKSVRLSILRGGERLTVQVDLSDRSVAEEAPAANQPQQSKVESDVELMGMSLSTLDAELAPQLGIDGQAAGVLVLRVRKATETELRAGDIIEAFAGHPVRTPQELKALVDQAPEGARVLLRVWRRSPNGAGQSGLLIWTKATAPAA